VQPVQRPRPRVSFAPADAPSLDRSNEVEHAHGLQQAPRRPAVKRETQPELMVERPEETATKSVRSKISKPARRGTIYIPTDDTTMPSMYMGIFSPIKNLDLATRGDGEQTDFEMTGIAAQIAKKKGLGKSALATSPRRIPLQPSSTSVQEWATVQDRRGQDTGKENVPPNHVHTQLGNIDSKQTVLKTSAFNVPLPIFDQSSKPRAQRQLPASRLYEPTASSLSRANERQAIEQVSKRTWNAGPRARPTQPILVKPKSPNQTSMNLHQPAVNRKPPVPSRVTIPNVRTEPALQRYPLLVEDVSHPEMYEENWLAHQEIAISQLVNNLFTASSQARGLVDDQTLRIKLLDLHGGPENVTLHKRLQAALLYGSLSVPAKAGARLSTDLGTRKAFTDLWLQTYELRYLRVALEVIVGRQCRGDLETSPRQQASLRGNDGHHDIRQFIETFLIRNQDADPEDPKEQLDPRGWSYQRTMLRSLMLIRLLDLAKMSKNTLVPGCLFQPSSPYKSSVSVVQALFQSLNPSAGDPVRALAHVSYVVNHSQYPLEEYHYVMSNMAVDLRDGVRLTRLVELLLYPSAAQHMDHGHDLDATTTILMPSGETLSLIEGQRDWPLSQHLKFPCLSRTAKLYNVQVALSALQGVQGMESLVNDIQAQDIVDGYREKTVKLLWGLTSKWGLGGLIDWSDVQKERRRLSRSDGHGDLDDFFDLSDEEGHGPALYKALLKSWAAVIGRKKGLQVNNLTTSFADGRIFEAIVDEYEPYLAATINKSESMSLSARLKALGCSEQFVRLFLPTGSSITKIHIFDRDFVLAALAFLCSRLLGPSQQARAAVTIQRAWREHWKRVEGSRKYRLKMVAEACVEAVHTRERAVKDKATRGDDWSKGPVQAALEGAALVGTSEGEEDIWLTL